MGKSALLRRQAIKLKDTNNIDDVIITITGNELIGIGDFSSTSQAEIENEWKKVICRRIILEITNKFEILDRNIEVEISDIGNIKEKNITTSLTKKILQLTQSIQTKEKKNISDVLVREIEILEKSIKEEEKEKTVWLLIDDIDAKYIDNEENQQRVGSFFSAIRSLAFSVEGLRVRASVRTDVWRNLRKMEDQDKIRQYVIDIEWQDTMLRSIFVKRILSYLQRENFPPAKNWDTNRHYDQIVGQVFVNSMPWDRKKVEPYIPIKILAGGRPRWMGQLCKLAGIQAGTSLIRIENIKEAMHEFGGEKISDIQKEHQHQFSDLSKLLAIFRLGKREYNRFQLLSLIEKSYIEKLSGIIPNINGYPFQKVDQLAEFLFQIDFLSGHNDGKSNFLTYNDNPELFQTAENAKNKLLWTVNASYRNFLKII